MSNSDWISTSNADPSTSGTYLVTGSVKANAPSAARIPPRSPVSDFVTLKLM